MKKMFLILIILSLSGCTYSHYVHNITGKPIYNVTVTSLNKNTTHGVIIEKSYKSYGGDIGFDRSDPPHLYWKTDDGIEHEQLVYLSRNPRSLYETHFVISENGVNAYFLQEDGTLQDYRELMIRIRNDSDEPGESGSNQYEEN